MFSSTRSTEGTPAECRVCGKLMSISLSTVSRDATCPHCGNLVWFDDPIPPVTDDIRQLCRLGADVETDDEDEVRRIRLRGDVYNDRCVTQLAKISGVHVLDIRDTAITEAGARRLRELLPETIIEQ